MLIKIFNVFLLLASAMTFAHAEYAFVSVKSDKHTITQHTTLDSQGLNHNQTRLQADAENETSDLDSLTVTPELLTWHGLSFGQQSVRSLANIPFKFSHPQSRAPPSTC